jgi:Flp pilus assembly protein TadD
VAVLAFAALTRAAYLVGYQRADPFFSIPIMDAQRYDLWGRAIAAGQRFEDGAYYQAPLYPHFVGALYAVFGGQRVAVYAAQLLAGVGTLFLLHRIAGRAYGAAAGIVAAALGALYGVFVFNETKLLPAALTVLLATLAVERVQAAVVSDRTRDWTLAGAALGLAALGSAGLLLLAAATGLWLLADRASPWPKRRARLLPLALAAAAVVAPVTIRNLGVADDFVLIASNGGITFFQGNNPETVEAGGGYVTPEGFSGSIASQREESRRIAEAEAGRALRDSEVSSHFFRKGLAFVFGQPGAWLRLVGRKLLRVVDTWEPALEYNAQLDFNVVRRLMPLPFGLVLALAALRLFAGPVTRREAPILLLAGVQMATLLLFFVSGRYRLPLVPALLALAGGGLVALAGRRRETAVIAAAAGVVLALALVSMVVIPKAHARYHEIEEAQGLDDRAYAYVRLGRQPEAAALYRRAIAKAPELARAQLGLGKILVDAGDGAGAQDALQKAATLDPANADPPFWLGTLAHREGRVQDAARYFVEAYRLSPLEADVAHNAIVALIQAGRRADAAALWREATARGVALNPHIEKELAPELRGAVKP